MRTKPKKKTKSFLEKTRDYLTAGVIVVVFGTLTYKGLDSLMNKYAQKKLEENNKEEIDTSGYTSVSGYVRTCPQIRKDVDKFLDDKKITKGEYYIIADMWYKSCVKPQADAEKSNLLKRLGK